MSAETRPPFSYDVKVGAISANPVTVRIKADARELKALAEAWRVTAVLAFDAELRIARWKRDGVHIEGTVRARIEQPCVVTLDPVETDIEEEIDALYVPEGSKLARIPLDSNGEMIIDAEGPDLPETFAGDTIDAGAAAAEFAAMAIDHYPRKPGVAFEDHIESDATTTAEPSPFAVLSDWKPAKS